MPEPKTFQHWKAPHDANGNPRRVFVVFDEQGDIYDAIDEGYSGRPAPLAKLGELPNVRVTADEYREVLRDHATGFFGPAGL